MIGGLMKEIAELHSKAERCERAEQEARASWEEAEKWKALAVKCSGSVEMWRDLSQRSVHLKIELLEEVVALHRHPASLAEHYAKQVYDHFMRWLSQRGYR